MQIVGYQTGADGGEPALLVADGGSVGREPLATGRELSYTLGERRCAGTVVDGEHRACSAAGGPYCEDHTSTWVCARCTGTCLKPVMDCHEEHAVYLAAFAPDTFKVGVTKSWRLEVRFREQGADRGAHVHTVSDGRIAREIEAEIAAEIPDRVGVPRKIRGLDRRVDEEAWRELLSGFDVIRTATFEYGLSIDERPIPETLVSGTVRGTKGRVLVVDRGGTTYAVDMRDLVGHELLAGATERDLQSSLGVFG
ncbi:DUF2797 domain-containing protein [Natronorarus salvus]|uniref:DUF2797 domain-containing protein n=1 Tax=Natronorarus salvus TaxID=3117733 RepID=UPI002F25FD8B